VKNESSSSGANARMQSPAGYEIVRVSGFRGSEFRNLEPFLKIFKGRTKMCGCCRFTIARNQNL